MNLIYDIGNTCNKLAIYDQDKMVFSVRTKPLSCDAIQEMISPYKIDKAIICSVKNLPDFIYDLLGVDLPDVLVLNHKTRLPFKNEYDTPETLGPDRIAAVAGAYRLYRGRNVLVIDAGTAITYDYLSGRSYKGGTISPGLNMRFRALHKFTSRLPLCAAVEKYDSPGKNTIEAITAGVINGLLFEVREYIRLFEEKYIDSVTVITGGDGRYLKDKIKSKINYQPDLVLDGLNYILEYNAERT
ncbi:MAG: type III pantothenate kinase [Bacteroidales bacterium]|jgi:type III pantothenate kinase|nr:type III pantothenate kinase [Bacteroidales bacterium]